MAYVNTKTNKLFEKDIEINLSNKTFNPNNEPRLKGKKYNFDEEKILEKLLKEFLQLVKKDKDVHHGNFLQKNKTR